MSETLPEKELLAQRLGYNNAAHMAAMMDKNPDNWNEDGKHISQMNRTQAQMELRRLYEKNLPTGLPLVLDTEEMLVYLREAEEHRDYIFWRAVETEDNGWTVEQCVDPETGTCSDCRVWLTPKERADRNRNSL